MFKIRPTTWVISFAIAFIAWGIILRAMFVSVAADCPRTPMPADPSGQQTTLRT